MEPQILVVEDDRGMCEFLEFGLSKRGFSARWTTEPQKALELLRSDPFEGKLERYMPSS